MGRYYQGNRLTAAATATAVVSLRPPAHASLAEKVNSNKVKKKKKTGDLKIFFPQYAIHTQWDVGFIDYYYTVRTDIISVRIVSYRCATGVIIVGVFFFFSKRAESATIVKFFASPRRITTRRWYINLSASGVRYLYTARFQCDTTTRCGRRCVGPTIDGDVLIL